MGAHPGRREELVTGLWHGETQAPHGGHHGGVHRLGAHRAQPHAPRSQPGRHGAREVHQACLRACTSTCPHLTSCQGPSTPC